MSFEHSISLIIDGTNTVTIEVIFVENEDSPDEFSVAVRRGGTGSVEASVTWYVAELRNEFSLQVKSQMVASGICLAGCLASIVTSSGPLVDCLKRARSRKDVRNCIAQHGVWQTIGSLSCIYGCLSL